MDILIRLQGTSGSPLTPLFLVHAISGLALPYLALGSLTDDGTEDSEDRPIYGITSPIFSNIHRLPSSIDEIAGQYISIMQKAQPEGPYLLGGWSFGGMIALKMASVLEERGEQVLRVIMIDSANPDRFPLFTDRAEHEKLTAVMYHNVIKRMNIPAGLADGDISGSSSEEEEEEEEESDLVNMLPKMRNHIHNGMHLLARENRFLKDACQAPVILIKCSTLSRPSPGIRDARKEFLQKTFLDERMGWQLKKFRQFHTVELSGSHDGVFDRGNVDELTDILRDILKMVP